MHHKHHHHHGKGHCKGHFKKACNDNGKCAPKTCAPKKGCDCKPGKC